MKKTTIFLISAIISFIAIYFFLRKNKDNSNLKDLSINYTLIDSITKDTTKIDITLKKADTILKLAQKDKTKKEIKSFPFNAEKRESLMRFCEKQTKLEDKDSLIASIIIKDSTKYKGFYKINDSKKFDKEIKELIK